jgi:hypothetical protein
MTNELRTACLLVAIILAILSAIPPLPYSGSLRGGAIAFFAAAHLG